METLLQISVSEWGLCERLEAGRRRTLTDAKQKTGQERRGFRDTKQEVDRSRWRGRQFNEYRFCPEADRTKLNANLFLKGKREGIPRCGEHLEAGSAFEQRLFEVKAAERRGTEVGREHQKLNQSEDSPPHWPIRSHSSKKRSKQVAGDVRPDRACGSLSPGGGRIVAPDLRDGDTVEIASPSRRSDATIRRLSCEVDFRFTSPKL